MLNFRSNSWPRHLVIKIKNKIMSNIFDASKWICGLMEHSVSYAQSEVIQMSLVK